MTCKCSSLLLLAVNCIYVKDNLARMKSSLHFDNYYGFLKVVTSLGGKLSLKDRLSIREKFNLVKKV